MWSSVQVVTAPASAVISAPNMKSRIRVDYTDDDTLIASLINGAIARIDGPEGVGIAMMEQTWRVTYDSFPAVITLPGWPVKSVTTVKYLDTDGAEQTLSTSAYTVGVKREPARIVPAFGTAWPSTRDIIEAVWVDYVVGESDAANVPDDLLDAVSLLTGHLYENREAVTVGVTASELPMAVDSILNRYRRGWVVA